MKKKSVHMLKKIKPYLKITYIQGSIIVFGWLLEVLVTMFRPRIIGKLTDEGLIKANFDVICICLGAMVCVSLIEYGNEIVQVNIFAKISNQFSKKLHCASFEKIMKIPISYLQKHNPAEVFTTINMDISQILRLANDSSFRVIIFLFQILGGVIGLAFLDFRMALVVLTVIPIKQIVILKFSKKRNAMSDEYIKEWQEFSDWYGAQVDGIQEIKLWNLYSKKRKEFCGRYNIFPRLLYRIAKWDSIESGAERSVSLLLEIIVYLGCGYLICKGQMSVGNAIAFLTYTSYVSGPYGIIAQIPYIWADIKPSVIRFLDFLEIEEEWLEGIKKDEGTEGTSDIEIRGVTFEYSDGQRILEDISLTVRQGEKVAIVGENGEGKTTLINLLLGLIVPQVGTVHLAGKTIKEMGLKKWRGYFALVSQKPYLFPETVKNNIDLEGRFSIKEIDELLLSYRTEALVEKFTGGMFYQIVGNSFNLSGGEKQKIAFLRAMIKRADILILDEATSNCDEVTRKLYREIVLDKSIEKTVIIISHYKEDVKSVDSVYKIKNHRLFKI